MRKWLLAAFAIVLCTSGLGLGLGVFAEEGGSRQPVFVYLQADVTDHVNLDITEDRLRHVLPMLEKLQKQHPDAHVSATVMFSGAVADALSQRNAQTQIVDFVKEYIQKGIIEVGYNGEDEPTYASRPVLDFSNSKTVEDRWHVRKTAIEQLVAEARDPITGRPIPGKSGGLKRVQEVFGSAAYVAGLSPIITFTTNPPSHAAVTPTKGGGSDSSAAGATKFPVPMIFAEVGVDSEIVYEVHRYDAQPVMMGLPEDNPAMIAGFGGGEEAFMRLISASAGTSPELYWQDNVLRLSEVSNTSEAAEEAQQDYKGLVAGEVKGDFGELNRTRVQFVRLDLADERYYLQHSLTKDDDYALKYAYSHPSAPALPAGDRIDASAVDRAYANEAQALEWVAGQFFTVNPGSLFVSNADLKRIAAPATGFTIPMSALRTAVADVVTKWGQNTYPPAFVEVGGHYLSLADTFQVLTDAFAEFDHTGKFPEAVQVMPVWGPEHTPTGHGPNEGEVTVADVARAAAGLAPRLHDAASSDVPHNSIPVAVTVGGTPVNSAQFLRLMCESLGAPSRDAKFRIRMTYMHPPQVAMMPKTRLMTEMGASWTIKPAQLQLEAVSQTAQK